MPIGKEEIELSLFTDDKSLYFKNPKDSTRNLLDTKNTFNNIAGCKINIHKSVDFIYT
jgi:hypothetical protein